MRSAPYVQTVAEPALTLCIMQTPHDAHNTQALRHSSTRTRCTEMPSSSSSPLWTGARCECGVKCQQIVLPPIYEARVCVAAAQHACGSERERVLRDAPRQQIRQRFNSHPIEGGRTDAYAHCIICATSRSMLAAERRYNNMTLIVCRVFENHVKQHAEPLARLSTRESAHSGSPVRWNFAEK